jgi:hypothetical protein
MMSSAWKCRFPLVGALLLTAGFACGPKISPEDMGELTPDVPVISGAEEPFPLPQLDGAESTTAAGGGDAPTAEEKPVEEKTAEEKTVEEEVASDSEAPRTSDTEDVAPDDTTAPPAEDTTASPTEDTTAPPTEGTASTEDAAASSE